MSIERSQICLLQRRYREEMAQKERVVFLYTTKYLYLLQDPRSFRPAISLATNLIIYRYNIGNHFPRYAREREHPPS